MSRSAATSIDRSAVRARAEKRSATCASSFREETGPRRTEEVVGEESEALGLGRRRANGPLELRLRARPSQSELELATEDGEGASELVTRVGNEGALALDRRLEALEHGVQGLAEAVDLVVRVGQGQAAARLRGRDRGCLRAHPLDRAQGGRRQPVPEERGEHECRRPDDEKLGEEPSHGLVAVVERRAEHEDARPARRFDRDGEESCPARHAGAAVDLRPDFAPGCPRELVCLEQRLQAKRRRSVDDAPVRSEQLGEALVCVGSGGGEGRRRVARLQGGDDLGGARGQPLVDRLVERVGQPVVEEQAGRDEDDGHGQREGEREAEADRKPAHRHSRRRRYPAPRTVSIELRPKGRSTFSRR
jgi:hypothetical protein